MIKNLMGWKTDRKILVIESDDWGSFRFKNSNIRDHYIKDYNPENWMHYNDCFESYEDLKALKDLLLKYQDNNGRHPAFTFLMNPANPDFNKIREHNFQNYFYEPFDETLEKRADGHLIYDWYKNALSERLIEVGFHGREHLNVSAWMTDLSQGDDVALDGFNNRIWGQGVLKSKRFNSYRSAFQIQNYDELEDLKVSIYDGIQIMNQLFKQETTYFLAPDGPYHLSLNPTMIENGIKYIGLAKLHNNPLEHKRHQKKLFWMGKRTKSGLITITRNVIFEPGSPRSKDWLESALKSIHKAFKFNNPAVISTHRANYVGGLNEHNRVQGLQFLELLLKQITKQWPNVEFMTSSELGNLISKDKGYQ
jgi:hypothetical protein